MKEVEAQGLAERIMREAGVQAIVRRDENVPLANDSCYIDVGEQESIRLCIRSEGQWEARKHLLKGHRQGENEKQQMLQEFEIQAIMRSLVKQLDQELESNKEGNLDYIKWFIERLGYLVSLASSSETEEQLRLALGEMLSAGEKLENEQTRTEYYPIACDALRLMRAVIK